MKKLLLSISALVILGLPKLSAQIINANFETWHSDYIAGNANDPNSGNGTSGWWDFNFDNEQAIFGGSPITVFEGSSNPAPEDSSHYAAIVSATMTSQTYSMISGYGFPQTNGIIITAYVDITPSNYPNVLTYKPGIPFNTKIGSLSFWYRYIPVNAGDTCSCTVGFTHFNQTTNKSYLIGGGYWSSSATQNTWKQATVNIVYDSASMPDTILIQFSACALKAANNPKAGDTMDIDNVSTSPYLGIDNISTHQDNVTLYPNPAQTEVNLTITGQYQASHVEVYDITGKSIGIYAVNNNSLTINTQAYPSGLYIYKLLDNTGVQLNVGKFSVVK